MLSSRAIRDNLCRPVRLAPQNGLNKESLFPLSKFVEFSLLRGLMKGFLVEANRFLYGFPEKLIIKSLPQNDMKLIEYHKDKYSYRNYFTEGKLVYGQIIISFSDSPLWCMQYHGGVTCEHIDERMERKLKFISLKNQGLADSRNPIRGPRENVYSGLHYSNDIFGTVCKFQGQEVIENHGKVFFMMKMSGGAL